MTDFTDAIIKQANWDTAKVREKVQRDIDAHIAAVRTSKLSELTTTYEVLVLVIVPSIRNIIYGHIL